MLLCVVYVLLMCVCLMLLCLGLCFMSMIIFYVVCFSCGQSASEGSRAATFVPRARPQESSRDTFLDRLGASGGLYGKWSYFTALTIYPGERERERQIDYAVRHREHSRFRLKIIKSHKNNKWCSINV